MRVIGVEVIGDHRLLLTFAPVLVAELSLTDRTWRGHDELREADRFAEVGLDHETGGISWPNGYVIGPEDLYAKAKKSSAAADGATNPTLVSVAAAVASGLGVLGFVAFAGGVVLWTRFKEMGLPADHALSLVPKAELLSTGADFLVPAVLVAAVLVVVVYVLDYLAKNFWRGVPDKRVRELVVPLAIGLTGLGFSVQSLDVVPGWGFILLFVVTALGSLTVSACARLPFAAFCLVVFLAAGTFAIARTYERTSHLLTVIPMAYSRAQQGQAVRVEIGYFVAETSDRIFFASAPERKQNELREFPRSETDDLEVGDLARPKQAQQNAARFAYNLCGRLQSLKKAARHKAAAPVCDPEYVKKLRENAKLPAAQEAKRKEAQTLRCRVPELRGHTLLAVRRLLHVARCKLGRIATRRRGHGPLVVTAQNTTRGKTLREGAPIAVTLGPRRRS